nr:MAG TPA: hypothetical protein [Caudoviricetes sp.]
MKFIILIIVFLIGVVALSLICKFIRERHIRHCQNCKYASFLRSMSHPRPVYCSMKCKPIQENDQRKKALFCIYFDSEEGGEK